MEKSGFFLLEYRWDNHQAAANKNHLQNTLFWMNAQKLSSNGNKIYC